MKPRRFEPKTEVISGVHTRIVPGAKFPGDLRLDLWNGERWVPVEMALAFFMVDFFSENEQARKEYQEGWVQNGDTYFLRTCMGAVKRGWRAVAAEVAASRRRRSA